MLAASIAERLAQTIMYFGAIVDVIKDGAFAPCWSSDSRAARRVGV